MGNDDHDSKVEVIEKHYHGNQNQQQPSGDGKSVAALVTSVSAAVAAAIPLVGGAIKKITGGGESGGGGNALSSIMNAIAPVLVAATAPRTSSEPRIVPVPVNGLGGFYGHECSEMAAMRARISTLEAEKYSDNAAKAESDRLLVNYLKPYGQEIAANQVVIAKLQAEIDCGKKTAELEKKNLELQIQLVKQDAECCCKANATAIQTVATILGNITKTIVPNSASCPGWGNVTITPAAATTVGA